MKAKEKTKISRYISLILRHHPEKIGISLDEHGWADVRELIGGVSRRYPLTREMLEEIVRTDEKQRYSFSGDGTRIRANQGHSIPVDVELERVTPPEILYHGTGEKYVPSIMRQGLRPKGRLYVHLSPDVPTAEKVGIRHGSPVVFAVRAGEMARDGHEFFRSVNGVWLTEAVPPEGRLRTEGERSTDRPTGPDKVMSRDSSSYLSVYSITVQQMREADAKTIAGGVPGRELMYRAAEGVYDAYPDWAGKRIAILVGGGNNGGDGYALAVILKRNGLDPVVCTVSDKKSEDGTYYCEMAREEGVKIAPFEELARPAGSAPGLGGTGEGQGSARGLSEEQSGYDVVVDCILGTGFSGAVRGNAKSAIEWINESGAYVISVDINSGMNGDTGEGEPAVKSDLTVSIGYRKHGMFKGRAGELIGNLVNVDIGIHI